MQEPESITLGSSYQYKNSGLNRSLVEKPDTFQYVPLLKNLEWLLQNKREVMPTVTCICVTMVFTVLDYNCRLYV